MILSLYSKHNLCHYIQDMQGKNSFSDHFQNLISYGIEVYNSDIWNGQNAFLCFLLLCHK